MPETTDYMILGYVVAGLIFTITIGNIWLRYRNIQKDEELLTRLENNEK